MSASGRLGTRGGGGVAAELLDWLAGLLSAPMSIGTVAACRSREGAVFFDAINDEFGYMPGVDAMRCAIEADESDEQVAARLSGCYMRLFEGPGGPATVSLYESTYAGTTRRLHQQATAAMEAMLCRCDMAVRAGYGEPPDHLSLEAGLLASLLRIDDQDAADELRQRLLGWVPRVTTACAAADPSGFYRGVLIAMHDTLMVLHAPTPVRTCHERSS
jgi:TorA-specific chaperone